MKTNILIFAAALCFGASFALGNLPDENGRVKFDFSDASVWTLPSGAGERLAAAPGVSGAVLQVNGSGVGSNAWLYKQFPFGKIRDKSPSQLAKLTFKARIISGSGTGAMTGALFSTKDLTVSENWETYTIIFPVSAAKQADDLRFGQWASTGTFQFAEAVLEPVGASFAQDGFSAEESYNSKTDRYAFQTAFDALGGAYSPRLEKMNCHFNTNRYCFSNMEYLEYNFPLVSNAPQNITLRCNIGYYTSGEIKVEYALDNQPWKELGRLKAGEKEFSFPVSSAKALRVRFTGLEKSYMQLYGFSLESTSVQNTSETIAASESSLRSGQTFFWTANPGSALPPKDYFDKLDSTLLPRTQTGNQTCEKTAVWTDSQGAEKQVKITAQYYVPDYYREDYGNRLAIADSPAALWWSNSTRKIAPRRKAPELNAENAVNQKAIRLSAAGNDYESAQLVFVPQKGTGVAEITAVSDLVNNQGGKIDKSNIDIRQVLYHFVNNPTDSTGVRDFWPDALVPLSVNEKTPFVKLSSEVNTPLWITVYVPENAPEGEYRGTISVRFADANKKTISVPVYLRVWGFNLPKENHIETAFGFRPNYMADYHGLKTDEDRRLVLDKYMTLFSQYRISPYDPVPYDPFTVKFIPDKEKPENSRAEIDFTRFDKAFAQALEKYHFTNYRLSIPGMWGKILDYKTESPEFQAMFKSAVKQIQIHLSEKGWLDKCYVYWFDEPAPADYPFVRSQMNLLHENAPKIPTMLTEEPSEKSVTEKDLGHIDIWCPVTSNYNHKLADACRAQGSRFWWYVCCSPRAPYCTEFVDHPAVELRTWLWQTHKYNVKGVLVWASNYWTSPTAFPNPKEPQNPYLDPMCYVQNFGVPVGTKKYWGNGDGRFIYPPLSCAQPSKTPCLDAPVPSIRLAMLREGIEDYEMLYLLEELLSKAGENISLRQRAEYTQLLEVPEEITSDMTHFSPTPDAIYVQREKIAQAIEALLKIEANR